MSTVVGALVLLPLALVLVAGLVLLLVRPLAHPLVAALERARFQRCLARAARGDAHLHAGQIEAALRELEGAFCLLTVRSEPRLVEQIARHHVGVLSRLLSVADELPQQRVRLFALAKVDRLLDRRGETRRAPPSARARPPPQCPRAARGSPRADRGPPDAQHAQGRLPVAGSRLVHHRLMTER